MNIRQGNLIRYLRSRSQASWKQFWYKSTRSKASFSRRPCTLFEQHHLAPSFLPAILTKAIDSSQHASVISWANLNKLSQTYQRGSDDDVKHVDGCIGEGQTGAGQGRGQHGTRIFQNYDVNVDLRLWIQMLKKKLVMVSWRRAYSSADPIPTATLSL